MKRREFVAAMAASLTALRERAEAMYAGQPPQYQVVREQLPLDLDPVAGQGARSPTPKCST